MKKITVYKTILVILIIMAIILSALVIKKNVESNKIENQAQTVLKEIKNKEVTNNEQNNVIQEIDAEIEGYKVVGIIKIPKIEIEYPILEKTVMARYAPSLFFSTPRSFGITNASSSNAP